MARGAEPRAAAVGMGVLNGCEKGGRILPGMAGQAIRGESGQDGTPAPRPLLRPILVQAAGPWFDDHARPREQGHLISTRILRGPLGGEVATRNFLEDRWAQNAPTKGPPPSVEGRGSKNSVHEITLDQGSPATKPADPSANSRLAETMGTIHHPCSLLERGHALLLRGGNIRAVIRLDGFAGRWEGRLWASQLAGGS